MKTTTTPSVERDERMVAVENAICRWGYILLTYALLIDVVYRGIVRQEAAWDLLALVIVGGAVCTIYQARQKTLPHGWVKKSALSLGVSSHSLPQSFLQCPTPCESWFVRLDPVGLRVGTASAWAP